MTDDDMPLSAEDEAYARGLDAADAQADSEFVKRPFRVISAAHKDVIDGYDEEDARLAAEYARTMEAARRDRSWLFERGPIASYGERYAHPDQERTRDPERII